MKDLDAEILADIEPVLQGMGYGVVEVHTVMQKSGLKVYIVITKKGGVNIDDTTEVLQLLKPRIQILTDSPDIYLEVSSPGIDRIIKSTREYRVFLGRGIKILIEKEQWIGGILQGVEENRLLLKNKDKEFSIPFEKIKKAKLDYTEEVQSSYGI
ncbi:MAG: ribosome maturation factor RimP [Spirochaetales bacterium]